MTQKHAKTTAQKADKGRPQKFTKSPNAVVAYSNGVRLNLGPFDVKFIFSQTSIADDSNTVLQEEVASIYMSPQHFKVMVGVLVQQLAGYEKRFGTIYMPSGVDFEMNLEVDDMVDSSKPPS